MQLIRVEIELIRSADLVNAKDGLIKDEDIKRMKVQALVDTGASGLVINEHIARQLNLTEVERIEVVLADGSLTEVLLGVIALEGMDLIVDMQNDELIVPPDRPYMKELSLRGIKK